MVNNYVEIRVGLQGVEVAKWISGRKLPPEGTVGRGIYLVSASPGVVLDLEDNPLGLRTLDDQAHAEFILYGLAGRDPAELTRSALDKVTDATQGLPARCSHLRVEVVPR